MTTSNHIINEIDRTFDSLATLSNRGFFKSNVLDIPNADIWVYRFNLPSNNTQGKPNLNDFYFVIPRNKDFDLEALKAKVEDQNDFFLIDIFAQFQEEERAILPRVLYKYFFDVNAYEERHSDELEKSDIEANYVTREPKFIFDMDGFESQQKVIIDQDGGQAIKVKNAQELLELWATNQTGGGYPLLLLGERGIGKSWLVKKFVLEQNKRHKQSPWLFPPAIYISLRELSKEQIGQRRLIDLIRAQIANHSNIKIFSSEIFLRSLIVIGKVIIVLDGLDEITKEYSDESFKYNLWEIFSVTNNISKLIISSRTNQFKSMQQIKEYFAFSDYTKGLEKPIAYNVLEREYRRDFNIWELGYLRPKEYHNFFNKYKDSYFELGKTKLQKMAAKYEEPGTIQFEILELSKIPAFFPRIANALGSNDYQLIDIIRFSIDETILEYNIYTDRAIFEFNLIKDGTIQTFPFDRDIKSNLVEEIAWYMFERQTNRFNLEELRTSIQDLSEEHDYEILVNDIKTQTFITLVEGDSFAFINESIYAYLVSRTFKKLFSSTDVNSLKEGITKIGRFDLQTDNFGKRLLVFLKVELDADEGMKARVLSFAKDLAEHESALFVGFRYLDANFKALGLEEMKASKLNLWPELRSLQPEENYGIELVLVPENGNIDHSFFMSSTEITNIQFQRFLQDENCLDSFEGPLAGACLGEFWQRHGKYWRSKDNPYHNIINEYHLIHWKEGKLHKSMADHPVVWVCWFACAQFCNWLSIKHSLDPYYTFVFDGEKFKKVTTNHNSGYRLPSPFEWRYAAIEGNNNIDFLWQLPQYQETDGQLNKMGLAVKRKLELPQDNTISVKTAKPNAFGLYNLMGNVREWVDSRTTSVKNQAIGKQAKQMIKGSGWLLDKDGLKVHFSNRLFAQSNSLDIGFRIARNLTPEEMEIYEKYRKNLN